MSNPILSSGGRWTVCFVRWSSGGGSTIERLLKEGWEPIGADMPKSGDVYWYLRRWVPDADDS